MDNCDDLRLLLASRYPLIIATEREEVRFLSLVRRAAAALGLPMWIWSATTGLALEGNATQYDTMDPVKALAFMKQLDAPGVFVFADAKHSMDNPIVVRMIKEIAQRGKPGQTIVITTPQPVMPAELEGLALAWSLQPPTVAELRQLAIATVQDLQARGIPVALDVPGLDSLVDALRGLSLQEAELLIQKAAYADGRIDAGDVTYVRGEKAALLEASGALDLIAADHGSLDDVGGLERLKDWLTMRAKAFDPAAAKFGITPPRGVLITGVPGCGKSLVAKTLARGWQMPLVLLDTSRLYGSYVGETEERTNDALQRVQSMAPVILWVDEIEKGFPSGGDAADGGVSTRMLGTFLRWMQDHGDGVFLIATCNQVQKLPPELLRKGRFDEVFFVDLPGDAERQQILSLHLTRRGRDPKSFDLARLSKDATGFSGAEIEAAIVGSLYRAFTAARDLVTDDIAAEIAATVPLSRSRAEEVEGIREWARGRAVPASAGEPAIQTS